MSYTMKNQVARWLGASSPTVGRILSSAGIRSTRLAPSTALVYNARDVIVAVRACRRPGVASGSHPVTEFSTWMNPADVAFLLSVSKDSILRWCRSRLLTHYRFGPGTIRIEVEDAKAFVSRSEKEGIVFCSHNKLKRHRLVAWMSRKRRKQ